MGIAPESERLCTQYPLLEFQQRCSTSSCIFIIMQSSDSGGGFFAQDRDANMPRRRIPQREGSVASKLSLLPFSPIRKLLESTELALHAGPEAC